jgi:WD40 repeat protein
LYGRARWDSDLLVAGGLDGKVQLWTVTGAFRASWSSNHGAVFAVATTPDSKLVISGWEDGVLLVWQPWLPRRERKSEFVRALAVSGDGHLAVSDAGDGSIQVWNLNTGEPAGMLTGHTRSVAGLAIMLGGQRLLSSGDDGTLRVWDIGSGQALQVINGGGGAALGAAEDGCLAVSALDRTVRVWDLVRGVELAQWTWQNKVTRCAMSADGNTAVIGDNTGNMLFLQLAAPITPRKLL